MGKNRTIHKSFGLWLDLKLDTQNMRTIIYTRNPNLLYCLCNREQGGKSRNKNRTTSFFGAPPFLATIVTWSLKDIILFVLRLRIFIFIYIFQTGEPSKKKKKVRYIFERMICSFLRVYFQKVETSQRVNSIHICKNRIRKIKTSQL